MDGLRAARLVDFVDLRAGRRVKPVVKLEKDPALRFTLAEHGALVRARTRTGPIEPLPDPIDADSATAKLATVLRVIRCIEEHGNPTVEDIARVSGIRSTKARELLRRLVAGQAVIDFLMADLHVERDATDRAGRSTPSGAILPPAAERTHPLGERHGRVRAFAYSRTEVADRLDLIRRALDHDRTDADLLDSARCKLQTWQRRLEAMDAEHHSRSGRPTGRHGEQPNERTGRGMSCGMTNRYATQSGSPRISATRRRANSSRPTMHSA